MFTIMPLDLNSDPAKLLFLMDHLPVLILGHIIPAVELSLLSLIFRKISVPNSIKQGYCIGSKLDS